MSHVDNVLFSFDILEDERGIMREVDRWTKEHTNQWFENLGDNVSAYGGHKVMETPLYAAAFNHFPEDKFFEFLRTLTWDYPENVQYIVKRQHEDRFIIEGLQ